MNGSNGVSPYWQSKEPEQDFPETLVLDFNNVDGPVIQSRPSSIYEKRRLLTPTRNEYQLNTCKVEPIYEPILPSVPPPLPKKSWDDKTYIYPNEAASRSDISFPEEYQLHKQRGPTPLQRSPVVDNVALKVLSEGRNLKVKQNWTSEDIVSHSAVALTSPCQNVWMVLAVCSVLTYTPSPVEQH